MGRRARMKARRRELRRVTDRLDRFLCGQVTRETGERCTAPGEWEVEIVNASFRRVKKGVGEVEQGVHTVLACGEHKDALRSAGVAVSFRRTERPAASG